MNQLTLTDDAVFERQQIRKRANAKELVAPVAVLPEAPCGRGVRRRRGLQPGRDLEVREVTSPRSALTPTGPSS